MKPGTRTPLFFFLFMGSFFLLQCETGGEGADANVYPNRPIKLLIPWAPGGMTDVSARVMATNLSTTLGQSVNALNRTGGGGVVGHLAISSAKPDGYTLGATTVEVTMMHHQGLSKLTFRNYTPLALIVNNPGAVTVRADAPWNTLAELIAAIEAEPGKFQASGTSKGGIWDLGRKGLLKTAGLPVSALPWVPSQGAAPALQELLAGGVDVVTASLAEVSALLKAGQVKCLGVMAENRLESFPDIPTLKEQGYDWTIGGWCVISAPANLPAEVKTKLEAGIKAATEQEDFQTALKNAGANIDIRMGQDLLDFIAAQDLVNGELLTEN